MDILDKARKILERPVCDHCLGRQFGQLLSGLDNAKRGDIVRTIAAMSIDKEDLTNDDKVIDLSNFSGINYKFHNLSADILERKKCEICGNIFDRLDKFTENAIRATKGTEFNTFLVGSKISNDLLDKEESLWEKVGIDWAEPLKAELNREIGKRIEKKLKVTFTPKNPDINIIISIPSGKAKLEINPLFIYGEYQKLVRGIPQTKWPTGKYKTSVEQIIAKPYIAATKGKGHKLHGLGREDIDARCLAWRPFVLEILQPEKRNVNIRKLAGRIDNKKVRVRNLRLSNIQEVRRIKEMRLDKSYRAIVKCKKPITRNELNKLSSLVGEIRQRTPERVVHRRADLTRKRKIIFIKAKLKDRYTFELLIRGEAGLYVKELICGDKGRTMPSVSEVLGKECFCKQLDVVKIHKK